MRSLSQAVTQALSEDKVRLDVLVHLDFATDPQFFHTGNGDIAFGGNTYVGTDDLISIGDFSEDLDGRPNSIVMSVGLAEDADIELILNQDWQGRTATMRVVALDDSWQIIDEPIFTVKFSIEGMPMQVGKRNMVSIELTSEMADWDRPNVGRYTHQFQQYRFQGDKGLEFVHETVDREINWGVPGGGPAVNTSGGGGYPSGSPRRN